MVEDVGCHKRCDESFGYQLISYGRLHLHPPRLRWYVDECRRSVELTTMLNTAVGQWLKFEITMVKC